MPCCITATALPEPMISSCANSGRNRPYRNRTIREFVPIRWRSSGNTCRQIRVHDMLFGIRNTSSSSSKPGIRIRVDTLWIRALFCIREFHTPDFVIRTIDCPDMEPSRNKPSRPRRDYTCRKLRNRRFHSVHDLRIAESIGATNRQFIIKAAYFHSDPPLTPYSHNNIYNSRTDIAAY